jgi:hypothetical protein
MAIFATTTTRGKVVDAFIAKDRLQQVAHGLSLTAFRTRVLVTRELGAGPAGTAAPVAQRVRYLNGAASDLDRLIRADVERTCNQLVGRLVPQARRASGKGLSVFALEPGTTVRIDLACEPALPTDLTLTFICRPGGGAEAFLQVWCSPLAGCGQPAELIRVPLSEQQAALLPAHWPTELAVLPRTESDGPPLFAVIVLLGLGISP